MLVEIVVVLELAAANNCAKFPVKCNPFILVVDINGDTADVDDVKDVDPFVVAAILDASKTNT